MSKARKYLLIDNFDSFTYNVYALLTEVGASVDVIKNNGTYVDPSNYDAIVFSPGPSGPDSSGLCLDYIDKWVGKKHIFGVCLGMQIMGYYLGYKVEVGNAKHGFVDTMVRQGEHSKLYAGMSKSFQAVRYHSLVVRGVPAENVTSIATTDNEAMSLEFPDKLLYGVQYHPESYKSNHGFDIVSNFNNILV